MDQTPLKNFLSSFFSTLLKSLGGAAVAHGLVSQDSASGLLTYAPYLSGAVLIGAGQIITWLKSSSARTEIQFLRKKINHITALADAKLEHDFSAYMALHPDGEAFVDRRDPSSVSQIQSQPFTPKL